MTEPVRVNVLEVAATWGEPTRVLEAVSGALEDAPRAALTLLPELALQGYVSPRGVFDPTAFAEPEEGGPIARALAALAVRHETSMVASLVLRDAAAATFSNAAVAFGPDGARVFTYRKRHPWIPETWATAGTAPPPVVTIAGLRTTICVCFDIHFAPDDMAEELAAADLLLFPSAWVDEEDTRVPLLTELATRFGVWVAAANWSEGVVRVPGQGGSCILAPDGEVVARAASEAGAPLVRVVTADVGREIASIPGPR